jgi:precorrin-2 methylase
VAVGVGEIVGVGVGVGFEELLTLPAPQPANVAMVRRRVNADNKA